MFLVIFAVYPSVPAPCEGDDFDAEVIQITTEDISLTHKKLQKDTTKYVQIWEIQEIS